MLLPFDIDEELPIVPLFILLSFFLFCIMPSEDFDMLPFVAELPMLPSVDFDIFEPLHWLPLVAACAGAAATSPAIAMAEPSTSADLATGLVDFAYVMVFPSWLCVALSHMETACGGSR